MISVAPLRGVVDALGRDTVTFGITIRDVEQQVLVTYLAQKFINQRDGGRAIDVVVAVHHDLLTVADGPLHPFDRLVHILHQERVVQVRQLRTEEPRNFVVSVYAPLYE